MELNWSTFGLEILNFLVLVWILKALLFKPVMATIERRRAGIQQVIDAAAHTRAQAEAMKAGLEQRLVRWEEEKREAGEALRRELEEQRARLLASLDDELAQAREKARVITARETEEERRLLQQHAVELGCRFTARLLAELAGPDLEMQLVALGLQRLDELPVDILAKVREACQENPVSVQVLSAHTLQQVSRVSLEERLERVLGVPALCAYGEDPELLAGLRIKLPAWEFALNLRDELRGLGESWREPG